MKKVLSTLVAAIVALSFSAVVFAADVAAPAAPAAGATAPVAEKKVTKPAKKAKKAKKAKASKKEAVPAPEVAPEPK